MFHFIYSNGYLTTGGKEFYGPSSISKVVKGKTVLWVKCQIFHRPFSGISRFNLEVVSKMSTSVMAS